MIFEFLDLIDLDKIIPKNKRWSNTQLGSKVLFNAANKIDEDELFDIAIIGVSEDRGNDTNQGSDSGLYDIRKEFYKLHVHFKMPKIVDLGNVKIGKSLNDTLAALTAILQDLHNKNITTIVLGGSHHLSLAQYKSFQHFNHDIDLVVVDQKIDISDSQELTADSHLHHIITSTPNNLFTLSHIGHQLFYNSPQSINKIEALGFDTQRLGHLQSNLLESEALLRNADLLSFDLLALNNHSMPAHAAAAPSGLTGVEACRICRFAGFSNKLLSFGLYEYNQSKDTHSMGAKQVSQMMWYFLEGFSKRKPEDHPSAEGADFTKFMVHLESASHGILFLKSNYSGKWWMEIPSKYGGVKYLPCSYADYKNAMKDDLPDSWMKVYNMLND